MIMVFARFARTTGDREMYTVTEKYELRVGPGHGKSTLLNSSKKGSNVNSIISGEKLTIL